MTKEGLELLPLYQSTKQVRAARIIDIKRLQDGRAEVTIEGPRAFGSLTITIEADWLSTHTPRVGGYFGVEENGELFFCPQLIFERIYGASISA